ncbi:phospholipid-translocating P-type ATPase family protein [Theileria parva strain Muguga]|uniref:Phospholipid-transporting ATPase n=1 Tax=Theileria parva TaxID=5875 RepID=Q4N467_THEPA|nr:phospholipid-translocating P-type ATPase family protein [Theileria parva strain Muguga]EAN33056.1 phospholipid-translocating P-type ATPase family protein [Theileria parva strain Muguga]|eukprot:XP_765339.1 phospholipid-transporting ATPase [Theileria parva strain Muguga]
MKGLEEKINDNEWFLYNLERPATLRDRITFYFHTRFNRRPYKSIRCISNKGGTLPKLFLYNGLVNSKYNFFTFVPLVLYSQFRVFINLFYLSMCLTQLVPILRVESPIVHLFPLSLVVAVCMLKEGIEDYKRHVRDREHNTQKFSVYQKDDYVDVSAERLKLGQLITLKQGQRVPADLLLLKTSDPNGASFVRTDQLDGETDWKLKRAVATTQAMSTVKEILSLYSVATVEEPKDDFYNFTGKICFYHTTNSVDQSNQLDDENSVNSETNSKPDPGTKNTVDSTPELNNSDNTNVDTKLDTVVDTKVDTKLDTKLDTVVDTKVDKSRSKSFRKKTSIDVESKLESKRIVESLNVDNIVWMNSIVASGTIHGLTIYIGKDARACLNSKRAKMKYGLFEKELNRLFIVLILIMLVMCVMMLCPNGFMSMWYVTFLKYLLLFSTVVPLSLRISLEIAKYVYNRAIVLDNKIPQTMPRTTMIPEELGRINYLLTDKTGTLTQNVISLEKLYITRGYYTNEDVNIIKDKITNIPNTYASSGNSVSSSSGNTVNSVLCEGSELVIINNNKLNDNLENRLYLSLLSLAVCHNVRPISESETASDPVDQPNNSENLVNLQINPSDQLHNMDSNTGSDNTPKLDSIADSLVDSIMDSVMEEVLESDMDFQGSSPDEIALVKFANLCNVKLVERDDYKMILMVNGIPLNLRILFMIPFSSETKRMGIIVEDECGRKHFFLKGAEVVVIPMLLPRGSVWLSEECDNLARMGLRTLVFAYRAISDSEYDNFVQKYNEANLSLYDRVKKIRKVTGTLEHGMLLVGLTGVRDKLQRNVGSTLESLKNAGIKIWMLTGDKIDTAKCVAISCGMIQKNNSIFQISVDKLKQLTPESGGAPLVVGSGPPIPEMIEFISNFNTDENDDFDAIGLYNVYLNSVVQVITYELNTFIMGPVNKTLLILDSFVINIAVNNCFLGDNAEYNTTFKTLRRLFVKSLLLANNVLFCRCTPQMKADIVKLLKSENKIVCSIGDGDNDVPMISEANVGIGIVGKEGLQASLSSDYSLVEFSHIKRLLLWHGRNSYKRSSTMSNFLIHRGVIISVMQAIFSTIYYFMPIAFFQGWLLVGFTSYYNMIPIFCLVLDEEICEEDVMLFPELYVELKKGRELNIKTFLIWIWISIFQGAILMIGAIILFENSLVSLISIGCTSLFLLEILNLVSELHHWHRLTIIGLVCTCIVYFYSLLVFRNNFDMEFIARKSFFWKVLAISMLGWLPIYVIKYLTKILKPPQYIKLIVT